MKGETLVNESNGIMAIEWTTPLYHSMIWNMVAAKSKGNGMKL
jgi:hypothetical protein